MWPWGHLAVGYLSWSLWARATRHRPPRTIEVWIVVVATQFPDFVDKFLAWHLNVLPSGRSLTHSVFALVVVLWIILYVADKYDHRTLGVAFGVAYASHLLSEAISPILAGDFHELGYFLWPLTPAPFSGSGSILKFVRTITLADFAGYHAIAILACVALWLFDGAPGIVPGRQRSENNE